MNRRLPPLNALRAFEAAARHLSFTKAADELHVTQAAISHQVRALEEYLGIQLFRRQNRAVLLTDAAQLSLPRLREAFDQLAEAVESMGASNPENLLTVSVTPSFAAKWLVPRLDGFRKARPDLEVRLDASTQLVDFGRDNVDVAIRYGAGRYAGLMSELLMDVEVSPVCSPQLLKGEHPLATPSDLRWHRLLHTDWSSQRGEEPDWRMWLLAAGVRDIDWAKGPQFNDWMLAMQAALEGQGVVLGRSALVANDLAAGRLVRPFNVSVPGKFAYYLVYPESAVKRAKVAAFRDWLTAEAAAPL
jgi:LysR family transcriptional regulator, glycine cleavage system transcriptional activator